MVIFYNVCLVLFFLFTSPYYLLHMFLREHYRAGFWQRLGFVRVSRGDKALRVWLHGVSVGEIQVLLDLGEALARDNPAWKPIYSTTTLAAQRLATARLGTQVDIIYFPLDLPWTVRRALDSVQPGLVVVAETELWPNFLRQCHKRGIPVVLVNGRISDRSFGRYRYIAGFTRLFLPWIEKFMMQSEVMAQRIIALGAPADSVMVTGNMKADVSGIGGEPPAELKDFFQALRRSADTRIVLAGSTHPGEEKLLAGLFTEWRRRFPGMILVLAPRHITRVPELTKEMRAMGSDPFLRSQFGTLSGSPSDIAILDTLGELAWAYAWADIVFIGKSLLAQGGQNPIEAARQAKPVIFGPHMENFAAETRVLLEAGGAMQVQGAKGLGKAIEELLGDPVRAREMGARAQAAVGSMGGATKKNLQVLRDLCARLTQQSDQR